MVLFPKYRSRIVKIGDVPLGGNNTIRIQSMTSTNTMDTEATVAQSIRMIDAGCEFVRITTPGIKEANHLSVIKKELRKKGFNTPIIADVHYQPKAAEVAARIVEKVRINPGNYVDKKRGRINFDEIEYQNEVEKIYYRIKPLIQICKENGTALRIGSNHGSLSERILYKYGDTPAGMVESALEFVRICQDLNFHNLVLSMKSSNVKVMIQANRLLVKTMIEENMDYPIHLGVTEAGDAEDGRIKSAAGIGPLLEDGIGDTVRVSLTEDPEFEIPVAKSIISYNYLIDRKDSKDEQFKFNPFSYERKKTKKAYSIGGMQVPVVILETNNTINTSDFDQHFLPDYLIESQKSGKTKVKVLQENQIHSDCKLTFRIINSIEEIVNSSKEIKLSQHVLVVDLDQFSSNQKAKHLIDQIVNIEKTEPIIIKRDYGSLSENDILLQASADFPYFLIDGFADGIWMNSDNVDLKTLSRISFGILQATGDRISKTEYIACPSCGRTLFNIQRTLQKIKSQTENQKGLKIGVMGCCVNGPGEMADADYGYVGAGKGKITLYKGKEIMKTGVPEDEAVDRLIEMIKNDGRWK